MCCVDGNGWLCAACYGSGHEPLTCGCLRQHGGAAGCCCRVVLQGVRTRLLLRMLCTCLKAVRWHLQCRTSAGAWANTACSCSRTIAGSRLGKETIDV